MHEPKSQVDLSTYSFVLLRSLSSEELAGRLLVVLVLMVFFRGLAVTK